MLTTVLNPNYYLNPHTALLGGCRYHPHVADEETEARKVQLAAWAPGTAGKWQEWDPVPSAHGHQRLLLHSSFIPPSLCSRWV